MGRGQRRRGREDDGRQNGRSCRNRIEFPFVRSVYNTNWFRMSFSNLQNISITSRTSAISTILFFLVPPHAMSFCSGTGLFSFPVSSALLTLSIFHSSILIWVSTVAVPICGSSSTCGFSTRPGWIFGSSS